MHATDYIRFIMALLFVLALMGGLHVILRRIADQGGLKLGLPKRRLKMVEVLHLDTKHKAILLRRDDEKEHLVILGPSGETVIESNDIPPASQTEIKSEIVTEPNRHTEPSA